MVHNKQKVAIIGAGLAGCAMAYELSQTDDFEINIFDKNTKVASGASGNFAGILSPYLTSDYNYSDQFHTQGYQIILDFINQYKDDIEICNQGVLQILSDKKDQKRYHQVFKKRNIPIDLAKFLSKNELSKFIDMTSNHEAIYYPNALSLVPKSICQLWLKLSNANLTLDTELVEINKNKDNTWSLKFNNFNDNFDIVIFAGGYELFKKMPYLQKIPVYSSQGQLTVISKKFEIDKTIMDKGYIIPNYKQGLQVVGATFRNNDDISSELRIEDDEFNLLQIKKMLKRETETYNIVASRVATRCVTSDHLPLIGKLVDYVTFEQDFYKPLSKGYPKSKIPQLKYEEGLYLLSGFGSKGLCSSLFGAKIISSLITKQELSNLDKLIEILAPQRFWLRSFKKSKKIII